MLNQPQIEAAYHDWLASVERITQQRLIRIAFVKTRQQRIAPLVIQVKRQDFDDLAFTGENRWREQQGECENDAAHLLGSYAVA